MRQVFYVPVICECGERVIWAADVQWLLEEGLDVATLAPTPLVSQRFGLPPDAADVTGQFSLRCRRCFNPLFVLPLMRARLMAGAGLLFQTEAEGGGPGVAPAPPGPEPGRRGARMVGREGRRKRRTRPPGILRARASVAFDLRVVDISAVGLRGEHLHEVQPGMVYTLYLALPGEREALRVQARAVWTQPHEVEVQRGTGRTVHHSGFEFLGLVAPAAAALERYLAGCLRQGPAR